MSGSFQNEIPPARVNIHLSVDEGGAQKKVELPLKLLVMGDFSQRGDATRVIEKEKVQLDKDRFNGVMESLGLGLDLSVDDRLDPKGGEMKVRLDFKSMKSFEPGEIIKQVPALSRLLAARNLVKDLKSNLLDNKEFRRRLETILKDKGATADLMADLEEIVPLGDGDRA